MLANVRVNHFHVTPLAGGEEEPEGLLAFIQVIMDASAAYVGNFTPAFYWHQT